MEAHVTAQSQSFRLVERMQEAKIRHGQEVRADLTSVRVLSFVEGNQAQVRFCEMGPISVKEILVSGEDRPLPTEVVVEGLKVLESGMYDLLNARVSSNGVIRLVVDEQTCVREGVGAPRHAPSFVSTWRA